MKTLLILGAGTGGTIVANKMAKKLDPREWQITIVDNDERHIYQPGLLFIPFGTYTEADVLKPRKPTLNKNIRLLQATVDHIDHASKKVKITPRTAPAPGAAAPSDNPQSEIRNPQFELPYDQLVIGLGCDIAPEETPGMKDGGKWHKNIFDYYTLKGALALRDALKNFQGGRLVLNICEFPYKCPVAPLEFVFLADYYFKQRGIRDKVQITFVTPSSGPFTKPVANAKLSGMFAEKNIAVEAYFDTHEVDSENNKLICYGEAGKNREVPYDLLVTIPVNKGADVVGRSGMGDFSNYVLVTETTQSADFPDVWAIGDAANSKATKAGSTAHFMADIMTENLEAFIHGKPMPKKFDGHTNCFIESGHGKALLIDYSTTQEPLPGKYPYHLVGPCTLLGDTRINHWGKLAFRWLYWHMLLPGRWLPISTKFRKSWPHYKEAK